MEDALVHQNGNHCCSETLVAPSTATNALSNVCLAVRFIRFGTYCTVPYKEGLVMESSCLILTVKEDSNVYANFPGSIQSDPASSPHLVTCRPYAFKIGWHNVRRFEFHVHTNCSVIYLLMSDNCARKIRETFGLNEQFAHDYRMPFYDPDSSEESRKYVTIGLSECRISWIDIVRKYIHAVNPQADVVALTYTEAMDRMRKSAPAARTMLPHQQHYAGLAQHPPLQQQIAPKPISPAIFSSYLPAQRHINSGGGGSVASLAIPVYQVQPAAVRQVPLLPIQIQQYTVANVVYQPASFAATRDINTANNNGSNINANRVTNMTYAEAYTKVHEGLSNEHNPPSLQYCQQNASTSTGSPAIRSSFSHQVHISTAATTTTLTAPTVTNKHFLQNIVLKVFKKFRGNDGAGTPVVPASTVTTPAVQPQPHVEVYAQQSEQQSPISNSNESQQTPTSSLQHSQANSDFLSNVPKNFELTYPSMSKLKGDSITLTLNDISCLEPDAFLNDNIIDFFLKYVHQEMMTENLRDRIYIFNSFFYSRLTSRLNSFNNSTNINQPSTSAAACAALINQGDSSTSAVKTEPKDRRIAAAARHRLVRTWTKNVDIFDKDFIVIPINENSHWYLAIICYPALFEQNVESNGESSTQMSSDPLKTPIATPIQIYAKNQLISSSLDPNFEFEPEDEDEEDMEEAKEQYEQLKDASVSDSSSTQSQAYQRIPKMTCIIIMDSLLCGSPRYKTVGILRDYLTEEFAQKRAGLRSLQPQKDHQQKTTTTPIFNRSNCRGIYPKVPQQDNYSDCGLYVLQFAESFLTEPPNDFGLSGLKKLQNLFPSEKVKNKRVEIRDILIRFFENRSQCSANNTEESGKSETLS